MNIKLITVCSHLEYANTLINSAKKNGWDIEVIESNPWMGFGTKLVETYNYLKSHPEVEQFVFADAFDVCVLGTPEEFESKVSIFSDMILSAERGLWPPTLIPFRCKYSIREHGFNYINSGLYYAKSKFFIDLFEQYPPFYEIDDQMWMNLAWLMEIDSALIDIDYDQTVFNSHSFIQEGEYGYEKNRVQIMGNEPIFIHFNGKSIDETFNERIKI